MQERARVSSMDLKAHMNNLRKNPKFTEEILKLVEADLQYGLSIEETEQYTNRRYDYAQMKAYSACLRNGYPEEVKDCITREGLTGEQMAVALEFYEKRCASKNHYGNYGKQWSDCFYDEETFSERGRQGTGSRGSHAGTGRICKGSAGADESRCGKD